MEETEIKLNDWKKIRMQLLKNVKVIDAPPEMLIINYWWNNTDFFKTWSASNDIEDTRFNLGRKTVKRKGYYWTKLKVLRSPKKK